MKAKSVALAAVVASLVSGCATTGNYGEAPSQGADVMFNEETKQPFERIDLVHIFIDPSLVGFTVERNDQGQYCWEAGAYDDGTRYEAGCLKNLDHAYGYFEAALSTIDDEERRKAIRTRVQDRIIAASNQRCGDFLRALHQYEADKSFQFGALATLLAGAGAVFNDATTARALSGASSVISGTRAEFSNSYYRNKAIDVLTKGIRARRRAIREGMCTRAVEKVGVYTAWAAIADAVEYHSACNVITGLEEASDSITKVQNPGPDQLSAYLDQLVVARDKAKKFLDIKDVAAPAGAAPGAAAPAPAAPAPATAQATSSRPGPLACVKEPSS